jgi:hypothetical protein
MNNVPKKQITKLAYAVVDDTGRGHTIRHGVKENPSVYDYQHNAAAFMRRAMKLSSKLKLRVVECEITFEL